MKEAKGMGKKINGISKVVEKIIAQNQEIHDFWCEVSGWAPDEAAELLAKSRLDRQVSLSHCLTIWLDKPDENCMEGCLVLAWANLGSLVEGTMKFFLSVFLMDYLKEPAQRYGKNATPDDLQLEQLRQFFLKQNIWVNEEDKNRWDPWVLHILQRRNIIHTYKDREIGTFEEFWEDLGQYLEFLNELEGRVPYPDMQY